MTALFEAAGVTPDDAFVELTQKGAGAFARTLGVLRFWERDLSA
ncbi:MAG: hypothetical protein ABR500_08050 [Dermatophilaceae bacterium]